MDRWSSRPFALVAVAAAAVVGFVPSVITVALSGRPEVAGSLAFQLMLALAGSLLWVSPESRAHGIRLVLASALVGLANLSDSVFAQSGYWNEIGWVLQWAAVPLIATVLLAYPAARIELRSRRVLVGLAWVWAIVPWTVNALLWDDVVAGVVDTRPWFRLAPMNDLAYAVYEVGTWFGAALAVWFAAAQVNRWRSAHGAALVPVRIVSAAGVALAVTLALRSVSLTVLVTLGQFPEPVYVALFWAQNAIGVLAGAALVLLGLRSATRRGVVVEQLLSATGDPRAVQDVLRTVLVDPTLVLSFHVDGAWVRVDGDASGALDLDGRVVRVIVEDGGQPVARVDADSQVLADPAGLRVTLAAAAMAVQNTRLTMERAAHVAEVQASRTRIVEAGVAQRRELERDLHDGAQQSLLAVAATLSRASLSEDPDEMRSVISDARGQLASALDELRRLARGIHPAALSQGGLAGGLASLAAGIPGLDVHLGDTVATTPLPAAVESTAYYVIAESVTNAVKHGGDCTVAVDVDVAGPELLVTVADDGPGGARVAPGGGLAGLLDRVRALGGSLEVRSPADAGTRVRAVLPLAPAT